MCEEFFSNLHRQRLLSGCHRTLHVFTLVHETHVAGVGQRLRAVVVFLVAHLRRRGLLRAYKWRLDEACLLSARKTRQRKTPGLRLATVHCARRWAARHKAR